ncbi:MAG TPA: DUF6261 family protein [Bacteroidales bacterium]
MIDSINYSLIPNEEFYAFDIGVLNLFDGKNLEGTGIEVFVKKAVDASAPFANAFKRESKNPFTEKSAQSDSLRGECHIAFRNYVEACSHRNKPGYHDASVKIMEIIRKHGWSAAHLGRKTETTVINSTVSEIREKCQNELTVLSAAEWLNELDTAEKAHEAVEKEGVTPPQNSGPTLTETRPAVVNALRSLFNMMSLQYEVTKNAVLADYAKSINELITQTMATVKANATKADKKKNSGTSNTETGK